MKPGIHYGLTMAEYLAIPAVSAGLLRRMLTECPRAAWFASWLNPHPARGDDTKETDAGTIAHEILLEGSRDCLCVIDPADHPNEKGGGSPAGWTNKSIRAARDAARAAGKIPILPHAVAEIDAMVSAGQAFIESLSADEPAVWQSFQPDGGTSETVLVWQEGGTLCKIRCDRLAKEFGVVTDYKSTSGSVEPDRWSRAQVFGNGYEISAGWYRRGVRAVTDVDPAYVFIAGETCPPYLHSIVGLDPESLALADEKCGVALRDWQECVKRGDWPAYPSRVCYPSMPVYERTRWDERNGIDEHGIPYDLTKLWGEPKQNAFSKTEAA